MIALIDQINVLNRDTRPHMISHSYVHSCTFECMHVSTHTCTSLASADPPWGQEHQCPCGASAPWYHAGQIFLSAWMTPWHGVYLDWQLVFIWINIQHREKKRWTDGGSGRQEHAPIFPDARNTGGRRTSGKRKRPREESAAPHVNDSVQVRLQIDYIVYMFFIYVWDFAL